MTRSPRLRPNVEPGGRGRQTGSVRTAEWIVAGYLLYVLGVAWGLRIAAGRRTIVTAVVMADAVVLVGLSFAETGFPRIVRDWTPALQILVAYWLSGAFLRQPMPRAEAALLAADDVLFGRLGADWFVRCAPRWVLEYLELTYLTVYAVVPLGFAVVYTWAPRSTVDPYWTVVLVAELACYGMLPWIETRPPRALGHHMAITTRDLTIRRWNMRVLGAGSVGANTVPSGHAAGAIATALAAGTLVPAALLPLLVLALSITAASVLGRYHYALDAVLGVAVALAAWGVGLGA